MYSLKKGQNFEIEIKSKRKRIIFWQDFWNLIDIQTVWLTSRDLQLGDGRERVRVKDTECVWGIGWEKNKENVWVKKLK